jgi:6-phosphogluconate dehydrogenase
MQSFDIGIVGLGVMGENLALNLERNGWGVCGFDLDPAKRASFATRTQGKRALAAGSLPELAALLEAPRRVLLMVPAGAPVDAVLADLRPLMAAGDVILDGGNTLYTDTERRMKSMAGSGLLYVGSGVSGGEEGALHGPALMPGGDSAAWPLVRPLLQSIAAKADDGQPCCEWMGPGGAGHFVKMVHNGIEYADMQAICEAYWLLHRLLGLSAREIAPVFARWNEGALNSYLVGITAEILARTDEGEEVALVDRILDTAEQKGTGKWASQVALDLGVAAPTIAEAVFARTVSALKPERVAAAHVLAGPPPGTLAGHREAFVERVRLALLGARICVYAQGFALLQSAAREFQWPLDFGAIAGVWRAGCIIRSRLLQDIRAAYAGGTPANLLVAPQFSARMAECQQALREVVSEAALQGVPVPAFMSALAYYDAYRAERLPANLLQAQRDYFGAHRYERTDRPGKFHTHWTS